MTLPGLVPAPTQKVHHIGIAVRDLDAAIRLYGGLFGLEPGEIREVPERGVRGCFMPVGDTFLELLEGTRPDSFIGGFLESHGEGLHHVCFAVKEIGQRLKDLEALGIPLIDKEPRVGLMGGLIGYLESSALNGLYIELAEHD